jgi:hypothetical protein
LPRLPGLVYRSSRTLHKMIGLMMTTSRTPSLKTIARAVGVSVATVSNAYNKPDHLSAALRERIFATACELGYAGPDPAARSLRGARTGAIGVLSTVQLSYAFTDPFCTVFLAGLADVAERYQTSIVLMPLAPRADSAPEQVRASVEAVRNAVIDGVVIDGIDDGHPGLQVVINRALPRVRSTDDPESRCVLIDDRAAAAAVGAHLAGFGHRDVALSPAPSGKSPATACCTHMRGCGWPDCAKAWALRGAWRSWLRDPTVLRTGGLRPSWCCANGRGRPRSPRPVTCWRWASGTPWNSTGSGPVRMCRSPGSTTSPLRRRRG